jgi:hypothetical protein
VAAALATPACSSCSRERDAAPVASASAPVWSPPAGCQDARYEPVEGCRGEEYIHREDCSRVGTAEDWCACAEECSKVGNTFLDAWCKANGKGPIECVVEPEHCVGGTQLVAFETAPGVWQRACSTLCAADAECGPGASCEVGVAWGCTGSPSDFETTPGCYWRHSRACAPNGPRTPKTSKAARSFAPSAFVPPPAPPCTNTVPVPDAPDAHCNGMNCPDSVHVAARDNCACAADCERAGIEEPGAICDRSA